MNTESRSYKGWVKRLRDAADPSCIDIISLDYNEDVEEDFIKQMLVLRKIENHVWEEASKILKAVEYSGYSLAKGRDLEAIDIFGHNVNFVSIINYFESLSPEIAGRIKELKERYMKDLVEGIAMSAPQAFIRGENIALRYRDYLEDLLTKGSSPLLIPEQFNYVFRCAINYHRMAFITVLLEQSSFSDQFISLLDDKSIVEFGEGLDE